MGDTVVMVDTAVDMEVMVDTAVDMDTESKFCIMYNPLPFILISSHYTTEKRVKQFPSPIEKPNYHSECQSTLRKSFEFDEKNVQNFDYKNVNIFFLQFRKLNCAICVHLLQTLVLV